MDPTKNNGGVPNAANFKRPNGGILIAWDPNTGGIDFRASGMTKLEEIGLLQWCISMRMSDHLGILGDKSKVKLADFNEAPAGFKQ